MSSHQMHNKNYVYNFNYKLKQNIYQYGHIYHILLFFAQIKTCARPMRRRIAER